MRLSRPTPHNVTPTPLLSRRACLAALCALPFYLALPPAAKARDSLHACLQTLEKASGGRLGAACIDTADNSMFAYRGTERFPLCSTFKVLLAGAVLQQATVDPTLLARRIAVRAEDMVSHSPVTEAALGKELSTAELCAAALQYSDNTATNLLLDLCGGPAAVTAFARTLGDQTFRLDRREPDLNSCEAGDPRDTASPRGMAENLRQLLCGTVLPPPQRTLLVHWLKGNTTGGRRIRAGLPVGWQAGDKTGSGPNGTVNDIALLLPPQRPPLILTIYLTGAAGSMEACEAINAATARSICTAFG